MTHVTGIIFDKDGTLFDFNATWVAWTKAFLTELAGGDMQIAQALGGAIGFDMAGQSFAPDSPVIAGTPADVAGHLLPYLPGSTPAALITRMNASAALAPMQQATPLKPLLSHFTAQGIRVGLATNDAEAPARAHLRAVGVEDRFDFIAGCDSGYGAKPGPGQLLAFADQMGVNPADVLMVGDSRHDLIAGRAAGMGTVGVLSGLATARDLEGFADIILADIGHLPGYLMLQAA